MSFLVYQSQGLRIFKGDTATVQNYIGLEGELSVNTETKAVYVHDGLTPGGTPLTTAEQVELLGMTLGQLANVELDAPSDGQVLVYDEDAGVWKNELVAGAGGGTVELDGMNDVDLTTPADSQVLTYNESTSKWENKEAPTAGVDGITSVNGKVGIGTENPLTKLDIVSQGTIGNSFTGSIHGEGITVTKSYVADDYVGLLESSHNINKEPSVRIAARYNGSGSYLSLGTSNNYGAGITNEALVINPSGQCYINNFLYVKTASGQAQIGSHNDGWFHFYTDRGAYYFDKNCQASGGFTTYSDERLKENITVVENAVESLMKIRGVSFTWKKNADSQERREGKMFGVLAQEVLQIDPEMCEQPEAVHDGDEKFYTFDYSNLTPYFIEAIKEQQSMIENQQAKIDSQQTAINDLISRLAALEAKVG